MYAKSPKSPKRPGRHEPSSFTFTHDCLSDSDDLLYDDQRATEMGTERKMDMTEQALSAVREADTLLKEKFYMANLTGVALSIPELHEKGDSQGLQWERVVLTITSAELYITSVRGEVVKVPLWIDGSCQSISSTDEFEKENVKCSLPDISKYKRHVMILQTPSFSVALTPFNGDMQNTTRSVSFGYEQNTTRSVSFSYDDDIDVLSTEKKITEAFRVLNNAITQSESYITTKAAVSSFYEQLRRWEEKHQCPIGHAQSLDYFEDLQSIALTLVDLIRCPTFQCDTGHVPTSVRDRLTKWKIHNMLMKVFTTHTVFAIQKDHTSLDDQPNTVELLCQMSNNVLLIMLHLVSGSDEHKESLLKAIGADLTHVISKAISQRLATGIDQMIMVVRLLLSLSQSSRVVPKESSGSEYLISSLIKCIEGCVESIVSSVPMSTTSSPLVPEMSSLEISQHLQGSPVVSGNKNAEALVYALQCVLNITSHDPALLSSFIWSDGVNYLQSILNLALDDQPCGKIYDAAVDSALHICLMLTKDARFTGLQQTESLIPILEKFVKPEFTLIAAKTNAILCLANLSTGLSISLSLSTLWNEANVLSLITLLYAAFRHDDVQGIHYELYPVLKAFKGFVSIDNCMDILPSLDAKNVIIEICKFLRTSTSRTNERHRAHAKNEGWKTGKVSYKTKSVHHDITSPPNTVGERNKCNSEEFTRAVLIDAGLAEIDVCIEILLMLCFYPENKGIINSFGIMPTLKSLYSRVAGWRNVSSLYHTLKSTSVSASVSNDATGDDDKKNDFRVMLSYCWNDQSTVLKLKEILDKHDIPYWIDVENMQGDVIDCMADAVESSTIILCCVSTSYFKSGPCRQEATFASSLKKHIIPVRIEDFQFRGWMGVLMSSMLYYDVGPNLCNTSNLENLLSVIKDKYASYEPATSDDDDEESSSTNVRHASVEKVGEWLQENDLGEYVDIFREKKICGKSLQTLSWSLKDKVNLFNNFGDKNVMSILREELNMSLGDALMIVKLLMKYF